MEIQDLENELIKTGLFTDINFLLKYISIIKSNADTQAENGKTQKHHIFPKCLSKRLQKNIDDTTINLQYKDHILAHYYLIYATNDHQLKADNIHAFNHLLKYQGHWLDEESLKELLEKQQIVYEQSKYLRVLHNKLTNSGGCYVNNGQKSKHIKLDELNTYLANGWVKGQIQDHSNMRGTVTINNGICEKRINPNELNNFIKQGWSKGKITGYTKMGKNNTGKISVYSKLEDRERRIDKEKLDSFLKDNPQYIIGKKKYKKRKK